MDSKQSKILGSLLGAAVGDAMGAATETFPVEIIKSKFGGLVSEFVKRPKDNLSVDTVAGEVTDNFSIAYFIAQEMIRRKSTVTNGVVENALYQWYKDGRFLRYLGATTQETLYQITKDPELKPKVILPVTSKLLINNNSCTNGAASRAGILGIFYSHNKDEAIDDSIAMSLITHNNVIAISSAAAVAAAVSEAMQERTSYMQILEAGIYGASEGNIRSKSIAHSSAGGDILKKMELAIEFGLRNQGDIEKAMYEISGVIGCGYKAYEAIPATFGYIAASKGIPEQAIIMGVNTGDDTASVATMLGFITGAYKGVNSFNSNFLSKINEVNKFCLEDMASSILEWEEEHDKHSAK